MAKQRTVGIEIEFITTQSGTFIAHALKNRGIAAEYMGYTHERTTGWKIVTDSSVRGGLELVSPVLTPKKLEKVLPVVMDVLVTVGCRVDRTCGLHVHVGAADYTPEDAIRLFKSYQNNESLIDSFMAFSRRGNNSQWCCSTGSRRLPYRPSSIREIASFYGTRYCKINFHSWIKYGTIEFRQHQGTLNSEKVLNWVKFCVKMISFCKKKIVPAQPDVKTLISKVFTVKAPNPGTVEARLWEMVANCRTAKEFAEKCVSENLCNANAARWVWGDVRNQRVVDFFVRRAEVLA